MKPEPIMFFLERLRNDIAQQIKALNFSSVEEQHNKLINELNSLDESINKRKECPFCGMQSAATPINFIGGTKKILCAESHGGCGATSATRDFVEDAWEEWYRRAYI